LATLFFPGKKAKLAMATPSPKDLNALRELMENGSVEPIIDRTYPLEQIAEAHAYSETHRAVGKIAVTVEEP
jgi:NADPH:quinone reductase-like Zn-dependent oxidoreductase